MIAKLQTSDVYFLHKLRDRVLDGTADQSLTEQSNDVRDTLQMCVVCDRSDFALTYEKLSLMLNKPTRQQKEVLQKISENALVHLRALAGVGKTFAILSIIQATLKNPNARVLLVSKTQAIVTFIASWLWHRTTSQC